MLTRREFLAASAAAPYAAALPAGGFNGKLCLFSKHLPEMEPRRVARTARELGFQGIDLTVRPKGHVLPERAAEDLPRAVEAIRAEGLDVPMITTALLSASDPTARPILKAAGRLRVPYFKAGYYRYAFADVRSELEKAGADFRTLVELGRECGVEVGYHNHAGYLGAPVWDMARIIDPLDPKWAGYYFDVCHATTEGGDAGWKIALNLVAPRLKMVAIKDMYWAKGERGWRPRICPLGEGMVDWKSYFGMLSRAGFGGPVSLHIEYDILGTGAALETATIEAARRDLAFLKARIAEAFGGRSA